MSSRLPTDPCNGYTDDASAYARKRMTSYKKRKAFYDNKSSHRHRLIPKAPNLKELRKKDAVVRDQQRQNYNRRHAARHLVLLAPGDSVWVKDFRRTGIICRRARRPRSYVVDIESGVQIECNRKMLVKQTPSRVPDSYDESYEFPPSLENPETSDQPNSQALQCECPEDRSNLSLPRVPGEYVT
ncbi:hypothetical protein MTO96_022854 [Rhipicephalus appendiculatus]